MRKINSSKYRYYSLQQDSSKLVDTILSVAHLKYSKGDRHPASIFPQNRYFLEHGGRSLKYYQLVYIVDGKGWFKNSNVSHDVSAGTLFIIRPGVWHSYAPLKDIGWESYYVEFSGPILSDLVEKLIPGIEKDFLSIGENRELIQIYEKMLDCAEQNDESSQISLRAYVSLMITLLEKIANPVPEDKVSNRARFNQAISFMEENLQAQLDIPEIAANFNFSYSHFRRIFKTMTGVSPMDYLKNLRLQKSKHLLLTTDLLVKQIAIQCGFSSGEYFCNAFYKTVGKTPSDYRASKDVISAQESDWSPILP